MRMPRPFAICTKAAALLFAVSCFSLFASGQSFFKKPEVNVFAGYSLLRFDSQPLGYSKTLNLNGGDLEISLPNLYQGFGIAVDFSGHSSSQAEQFNFLIGPQYRFEVKGLRPFVHGLVGKTRTRLLQLGTSQAEPSTLGYSVALGGGLDIPLGDRFSIRPIQADYLVTSAFGSNRHDVRYSTGIVVRFGKTTEAPSF
jgi:hypothetical protein